LHSDKLSTKSINFTDARDGSSSFQTSIMNTAKMNKKTTSARMCLNFLLVNKKFNRVGKQV